MKEIGGYFELELQKEVEYHSEAIKLNSGRNALEYVLHARDYQKVYLPYYSCEVMLEPILKLNLVYEWYPINEQLEPIFNYNLIGENETFLYINYFGVKTDFVNKLIQFCPNLIIDNSQAFFEKPQTGVDIFYSPRKFFGIPDGAYLFTNKFLPIELSYDQSVSRFLHLIKRIETGAESGYADFKANNDNLKGQPVQLMSLLTQALLGNIDYDKIIKTRKQNFSFLNEKLSDSNKLKLTLSNESVPMVFPYLTDKGRSLRKKLIENKIFVATYWPNSENGGNQNITEQYLTQNLLPLPVDQRYTVNDMKYILEIIRRYV